MCWAFKWKLGGEGGDSLQPCHILSIDTHGHQEKVWFWSPKTMDMELFSLLFSFSSVHLNVSTVKSTTGPGLGLVFSVHVKKKERAAFPKSSNTTVLANNNNNKMVLSQCELNVTVKKWSSPGYSCAHAYPNMAVEEQSVRLEEAHGISG